MIMNWPQLETRIRDVIRRVNNEDTDTRYGVGLATINFLGTALTEIDEILACETGRGAELDLGAIIPVWQHEQVQTGVWETK